MEIKITNLENAQKVNINVEAYKMYASEKLEVINIKLNKGEKVPLHDNPFDVVFYVLEGKGIFSLENNNVEVNKNSCIEVKTGNNRGWENIENQPLILLVMKKL